MMYIYTIFRKLHVKICVNYHCLRAARTGKSQTDLKHNFIFQIETTLTTKRPIYCHLVR